MCMSFYLIRQHHHIYVEVIQIETGPKGLDGNNVKCEIVGWLRA